MKTRNYLLPYTYKKIGMWMFLPFAAICLCLFFNVELPKISIPWIAIGEDFLYDGTADLITEVGMMGLLVSLSFIALSREKDEDDQQEQKDDKEVEALLKKAQERNDEHEADKKARMRKAPLPPNERDW